METPIRPLEDALTQLERHIRLADSNMAAEDAELRTAFRTAAVKSFEYAYQLAVNLIMEELAQQPREGGAADLTAEVPFKDAALGGLVDSEGEWGSYRDIRNRTPHAYDLETAGEVFAALPGFLVGARRLLERVRGRHPVA